VQATCRSSFGDRAFAIAGPRAWNSLPQFITECSSPVTFKKISQDVFIQPIFLEHKSDHWECSVLVVA